MNRDFDLIIIGAGPGGYELAAEAAAEGRKVVLFERDLPGGTCLNRGCIPTKALCRSAEVAVLTREASRFGIDTPTSTVNFPAVMARKDSIVDGLRQGVMTLLKDVTVVQGEARFVNAETVECDGVTFTAPTIVVATGSRPALLPIPGSEYTVTSNDMLSLQELPGSLVIIGGGVIGMEFASIFAAFGTKVTVIENCKEILPNFDAEIAKRLRMSLKRSGIEIITDAAVTEVGADGNVNYTSKNKQKSIKADLVLMSTGRVPVVPEGLIEAGATLSRRAIAVDPGTYEIIWEEGKAPTTAKVYAVGDVNGLCMLAHAATAQALSILGKKRNQAVVPGAVFTMPEAAMVGLTEQSAIESGHNIKVLRSTFAANGKATAMGETTGMVKLIVDSDTDSLLGAHVVGPHAADLVQEAAVLIANRLPHSALTTTIHIHPSVSEVLPAAR
ncbi:MAG: dihydrolipoyl dehydrogenase [Duncaniella sp.]|nr:dihydrolipoyl dehydrogenase [Duncaniella sp.]